ncbi:hypothetical protein OC834_007694, partial [Tilletia horrida]
TSCPRTSRSSFCTTATSGRSRDCRPSVRSSRRCSTCWTSRRSSSALPSRRPPAVPHSRAELIDRPK